MDISSQLLSLLIAAHQPQVNISKSKPVYQEEQKIEVAATKAAAVSSDGCSLEYIKQHESTNNYRAVNGQYTGAYQQSSGSWARYGDGSAPTAGQASPASQDAAAAKQYAAEGSRPWSVCH